MQKKKNWNLFGSGSGSGSIIPEADPKHYWPTLVLQEEEEKVPEPEVEKTGTGSSAIEVDDAEDVELVSNGDRKRPADNTNGQPKPKKAK